jgi:hypothetical protein
MKKILVHNVLPVQKDMVKNHLVHPVMDIHVLDKKRLLEAVKGIKGPTQDLAVMKDIKVQTQDHAVAKGIKVQTQDHAVAKDIKDQAQDHAVAKGIKDQTQDLAAAKGIKDQTQDLAAAKDIKVQTRGQEVQKVRLLDLRPMEKEVMVHRHLELIQKVDLQQKDQVVLLENHRRIKKAIVVVKANFKF